MRVFSIREMGWTPWPHFYNHMVWELWETTMSSILNVLKIFGFGHWRHWYQMSVPSSAQLVQPPSPTPFWSSFAGAQVEANFSDAETSLQLAEVGDVKWCPNSKPKLPELRKKQTAWRISTIFHFPLLLEMNPNDHSIVGWNKQRAVLEVSDFIETLLQSVWGSDFLRYRSRLLFFSGWLAGRLMDFEVSYCGIQTGFPTLTGAEHAAGILRSTACGWIRWSSPWCRSKGTQVPKRAQGTDIETIRCSRRSCQAGVSLFENRASKDDRHFLDWNCTFRV